MSSDWMIYGANGYTGQLVAQMAKERGHNPVIAGRNQKKMEKLALELQLDYMAFDLTDVNIIAEAIADMDLVFLAAGPFSQTSQPMIKACLATHTHYLDITGEIDVFETVFSYDEVARKNGIALIPGVGFDVVPSDSLAKHVYDRLPDASYLEIGIASLKWLSGGTKKSMIEGIPIGGRIRRDGELQPYPLGIGKKRLRFMHGYYDTLPIPWGDLSTAYRTTAIPNIITYKVFPKSFIAMASIGAGVGQTLFNNTMMQKIAKGWVSAFSRDPNADYRQSARSYLYAKASNDRGQTAEAWLDTIEDYQFTAISSVLAVEQTLDRHLAGALTPTLAFGKDFVFDIEGTRRLDSLDVGDWQSLLIRT
jgi:short subunit dehydrogenase-like uncharacterized protein